jgi:predicted  nucleic acid-binding Zn-ribbon protein
MPFDLKPLIELHALDQKIGTVQSSITGLPVQIQELDRKLDRFRRTLQEKKDLAAANQKKKRELESDLALIETKRNRYKEQLDTVKTNKEYTGLQHEIEGVNQAIRQVEDQILGQMEEAEQLKTGIDEAQKALDREEAVLTQEKKVVQAEVDKLQAEMDDLKGRRQQWVVQVPEDIMDVYKRTAMHRRGIALAEAKNEICLECHMRIRPQLFQEIKRNDSIIQCESCSRILYYVPPAGESTVKGEGDVVRQ